MRVHLRDFTEADTAAINRVALAAFQQYQDKYEEWEQFSRLIGNMASLAGSAEIVVGCLDGEVVGAVAYVGPGKPKSSFFPVEWPVLRMLVVDPKCRGKGIGRALTLECVRRAEKDGAGVIALHTSPIMEVALGMYLRMGFALEYDAPRIHGVPYGVYVKKLSEGAA